MTPPTAIPAVIPRSFVAQAMADHQVTFLSMLFLAGVVFLFASFGLSGWMHSRRLGLSTTVLAAIGLLGVFFALLPFIHVAPPAP